MHQVRLAIASLAAVLAPIAARAGASTLGTKPAAVCASPEFRQFDFFVGDWDTYDVAAPTKIMARNVVTATLDGCVLHEVYVQNDGLVGQSLSIYDASRGLWHQTWVTNRGALLLLDGRLEGGRMVLPGSEKATDGTVSLLRGTWPVFDILFRPHAQRPGS